MIGGLPHATRVTNPRPHSLPCLGKLLSFSGWLGATVTGRWTCTPQTTWLYQDTGALPVRKEPSLTTPVSMNCAGYANLVNALCDAAGVKADYVSTRDHVGSWLQGSGQTDFHETTIINPVPGMVDVELIEGDYQGEPEDELLTEEMINKLIEDNRSVDIDRAVENGTLKVSSDSVEYDTGDKMLHISRKNSKTLMKVKIDPSRTDSRDTNAALHTNIDGIDQEVEMWEADVTV